MTPLEKSEFLKKELDSLRPLKKEDEQRIWQKFRLDWDFHSNKIEGNSLTYGETKALILHNITASGKPLLDHIQVKGHNEAINLILDVIKESRPLTENFIREIHTLILKEPYEINAITPEGHPTKKIVQIGSYKTTPNHVKTQTGEIFRFADPSETSAKMQDLLKWYNAEITKKDKNPVLIAAEFHYRFLRIHPFDDGNGRTARIIMNFILIQFGYVPVIIKSEDKQNYYSVLRQADSEIFEPYINFILDNLNFSLELMIKGAKGEKIDESTDINKEILLFNEYLLNYGKQIEINKERKSLMRIFDTSITPLLNKLNEINLLISKNYFKYNFRLIINNSVIEDYNQESINKIFATINDSNDIVSLNIENRFECLRIKGYDESYYSNTIKVSFENTRYKLFDFKNKLILEKYYSENILDSEIEEIIKTEKNKHLEHIKNLLNPK